MNKRIVVNAVLAALVILLFYQIGQAVFVKNYVVASRGNVKSSVELGVYWDKACTNTASSIDWGVLKPSENRTYLLYVKNRANTAVTLNMFTGNFVPSEAQTYMTVTWDYNGATVTVNRVIPVHLTLHVSAKITGITAFTLDIILQATGARTRTR